MLLVSMSMFNFFDVLKVISVNGIEAFGNESGVNKQPLEVS